MDQATPHTPQPDATADEVLTTEEAARFLKISLKTLQTMVRLGKLHPRRFGTKGRVWRFVRSELLAPIQTEPSVSQSTLPPLAPGLQLKPGRVLQRINGALRYR